MTALPAPDEKHRYVRAMFDAIAPRYDLLNSLLSLRLHHAWRRVAADAAALAPGDVALDVCCGTGDLAFELARRVTPGGEVVATDFSRPMLALAERKRAGRPVRFGQADTQALPFPDGAFAAATVGFGIRNVASLARGLAELARVVRPGGRVVILEFSRPKRGPFAWLWSAFSKVVMPRVGALFSGRRSAYEYLPASIDAFASGDALADAMRAAGLRDVQVTERMFGLVLVHRGLK